MARLSLATLDPLQWQADALRAILAPGGGCYAWAGGKGSGKSVLVSAAACMVAATRPGAEVALVMDSYKSLRDIHLPFMSLFASGSGGEWRATDTEFRWASGSVVRLRHLDTSGDPRTGGSPIEGMNLHALLADELQNVDPRYWTVFHERARVQAIDAAGQSCPPLLVCSGLPVSTWWCAETLRAGGRVWRPKTSANTHNDPGYEARVRATMTERQARAMLDGEEYTPEGQIVEEFIARLEPEGTLTEWTPDWATTRTMLAMDLGLNNPHALLFAEDAERGRWVVVREWYSTGRALTLGEFCRRINADCTPRRLWPQGSALIPLDSVVTDPAGAAHSAQTGHSDLDMIAGARPDGLGIRPIIETIPERRGVATSMNRMRLAIERRRLMFSRAMIEAGMRDDTERSLARSLLGYRWDPRGREEPLKDGVHDHACDALRYGARRVLWGIVEAEPTRVDHGSTPKAKPPGALRAAKDAC